MGWGDMLWHNWSRKRIEVLIDSELNTSPKWEGWLPMSDSLAVVLYLVLCDLKRIFTCPLITVLLLTVTQ